MWHGRPAAYGNKQVSMPMFSDYSNAAFSFGMWDNQGNKTNEVRLMVFGF